MNPVVPVSSQPWRIGLACVAFAALFAALGARLHHLQVDCGDDLADRGEKQMMRTWTIQAPRGDVYDSNGVPLAVCAGSWAVFADPGYMDDRMRATVELNRILGIERDVLREHFGAHGNGRRIARGLDDAKADEVKRLRLAGVSVRREFSRIYPEGRMAPHVLGFVSSDGTGGAGVEHEFDKILAGVPGRETLAVDALGNPSIVDDDSLPAQPGANLQLTIDATIQKTLERALAAAVDKHKPANVAGIVVRPTTGEIVAMASWPDFDPTAMQSFDPNALRNNALAFVYEPGSTMKPLIAGAAVHERLTDWAESIFCENGVWTWHDGHNSRTVKDHTYKHGGHQMLTVTKIIALSDNIGMSKLGVRLGVERMYSWVKAFGFGQRCGICLPGEDSGIVRPKALWNVRDSCISISFGHEIAVTPLQMAFAHAAIANHGLWLPPRLIKRVWQHDPQSGGEREIETPKLPEPRHMFTERDAARIQEAMTHTMTEGTGKNIDLDGYTAAGKTGTTEKLVDGHYSEQHHIGSFVCWAPAEPSVEPQLLCLVVVDDPRQNGSFGGETAGPVVQTVLQQSLEYLGVPKHLELIKDADDDEDAKKPAPPGARRR